MRRKTFLYGVVIVIFLLSGSILALAANQNEPSQSEQTGEEVYLYTGSPLILSNGEIKMLDSSNPDLGATVIQSRTLLPLRAISEYFGAEVSYDQTKKEAVIQYEGKQYYFPIGSKKYIALNGQQKNEYAMDSQSMIIDGRTMVPLRVICENVLGKKVSYYDRVIAVAGHEVNLQSNAGLLADVKAKIGEVVKARTMKELEQVLSVDQRNVSYAEDAVNGFGQATVDSAANENSAPAAKTQSDTDGSSYSTTNVQVEGIDEADIVKTDGQYIYIAGNNVVRIVGADNGRLSDDTAIRLATNKNVSEAYVDDDRLIILGTRSEYDTIVYDLAKPATDEKSIRIMPPYNPPKTYSFVDIYDISDPLKPVFLKGHEMEGYYQSSRKSGDIVYQVRNT